MGRRLGIREVAKERGVTLSGLARRLGIYRSNMSAIASGARGVSLRVLRKISRILDCSIDELLSPQERPRVFKDKAARFLLTDIENNNHDGMDKAWVGRVMLAHKAHYRKIARHG